MPDEDPRARVELYALPDGRIEFAAYLDKAKWRGVLAPGLPEYVLAVGACEAAAASVPQPRASMEMQASRVRELGFVIRRYGSGEFRKIIE